MRAHLIDLSKWNSGFEPANIASENGAVVDGLILRASYGLMGDRLFRALIEAGQPIPVRGAYHYFSSGSPWERQADFFLSQVEGREMHFFALDFERAFNSKSAGFALGAQNWMQRVAERTGRKVLLYSNPSTYVDWLGDWMTAWPLWIAQYPYRSWNEYLLRVRTQETIKPWLPKGRRDWAFWQYSADGNGRGADHGVKSRDVDLNVFNGDVEKLHAWAGVGGEIPTRPELQPLARALEDMQAVIDRYRRS